MDRLIALVVLRWRSDLRALARTRERLLGLLLSLPGLLLSSLFVSLVAFVGLRLLGRASPGAVLPLVSALATAGGILFALAPLMAGVAFVETHDLSRLMHFPVPLRVLVLSSLVANLAQPMVLGQAPLLLAVSAALSGSLARLPLAAAGVLLSFAFALAAAQTTGLLLLGIARSRRLQDWSLALGLACGFLASLLPLVLILSGPKAFRLLLRAGEVLAFLPFAWGARAAVHGGRGELLPFLGLSGLALAAIAGAMGASALLIGRIHRGELSLGPAAGARAGGARMAFAGPFGALLEKDLRAAWREPSLRASVLLGFLGPLLIFLFLSQARAGTGLGTALLLLASFVGVSGFGSNALGFERRGIALLLGFPLPRAKVLVAKNLAVLLLRLPGFATLLVAALFAPGAYLPVALAIALGTWLIAAGLDNFVSVLFPVAIPAPGANPYGHVSGGRGLGGALVSALFLAGAIALAAPLAFLAWLPLLLGRPGLWLLALPLSLAGAASVYAMLVAWAGWLLERREPEVLERMLGEA